MKIFSPEMWTVIIFMVAWLVIGYILNVFTQ